MITKKYLTTACIGSVILVGAVANGAPGDEKPNIVIILADDLGYGDVGYHGCKDIPTPNIDSIARRGVSFSAAYVTAPVCGPSRVGLLTGRHQVRFGFEDNPGPFTRSENTVVGTPLTEKNIAERLKPLGYHTGLVGKWHDGVAPQFSPTSRGFDEFFGFNNGAIRYDVGQNAEKLLKRGQNVISSEEEYLTDAFGREAVSFIDRNHDKPFFLYVAFNAVHAPFIAPQKYKDMVADLKNPGKPKNTGMVYAADYNREVMTAMTYALDYNVGRVLEALSKNGVLENTLVIFLSDNGGEKGGRGSLNTPLRGYKTEVFEGGLRVPFCMLWQKQISPQAKKIDIPVSSMDCMPTIMAAVGHQVDKEWKLDGINLLPLALGETVKMSDRYLYWRYVGQWAVRNSEWKLMQEGPDSKLMLFHISEDIGETTDLAEKQPAIVAELKKHYDEWDSSTLPRLWGWDKNGLTRRNMNIPEWDR